MARMGLAQPWEDALAGLSRRVCAFNRSRPYEQIGLAVKIAGKESLHVPEFLTPIVS